MNFPFPLPQRWLHCLLGLLISLLAVVAVVGERGVFHLLRLKGEKSKLDEQNYGLQKENQILRQRIHRLRTDNFYLEKLAREELNLVHPGEIIYRFPSSEPKKNRAGPLSGALSQSRPSGARKEQR